MIVLIPAYEPSGSLVTVVSALRRSDPALKILVVDDGSGPAYAPLFSAVRTAGAEVVGYPINLGKGSALKTGFRFILDRYPGHDVVCADSDGQHGIADILRVAEALATTSDTMILGGRRFTGDVPLRSRLGNIAARAAFRSSTGIDLHDTQTGLRGFPAGMLPWLLTIKGDRFEYELNMLLQCPASKRKIRELAIETIYLEHNTSSHFRPVLDSARVAAPFVVYLAASLASFAVDTIALQLVFVATGSLLASVILARILSGMLNFALNRRFVFRTAGQGGLRRAALRYLALAGVLVAASYLLLSILTMLGMALLPAKILADTALYLFSFAVQRSVVFARRRDDAPVTDAALPAGSDPGTPLPVTAGVRVGTPASQPPSAGTRAESQPTVTSTG